MSNKKNNYWKAKEEADISTEEVVEERETVANTTIVPKPKETDIPEKVRIVWDSVDVRLGDAMDYKAMGTVTKGKEYPVVTISAETGWYALRRPGYILWVPPESVEPV